jgi:hypothetical protein
MTVGTVTTLQAAWSGVHIGTGNKIFLSSPKPPNRSYGPPYFLYSGYLGFYKGQNSRSVKLTIHLHLAPNYTSNPRTCLRDVERSFTFLHFIFTHTHTHTHTNWKFDEGFAKLLRGGGGGHNYIQTGTTAFTSAALIDICIKTSTLFQFTTS